MNQSEGGFSTIEALVAITIGAIGSALVFAAVYASILSFERFSDTNKTIVSLCESDIILRKYVSNVRIPFWDTQSAIETSQGGVSIPWFQGIQSRRLQITRDNELLRVTVADADKIVNEIVFKDIIDPNFEVVQKANRVIGISLNWKSKRQRYSSVYYLGSVAMGEKQ